MVPFPTERAVRGAVLELGKSPSYRAEGWILRETKTPDARRNRATEHRDLRFERGQSLVGGPCARSELYWGWIKGWIVPTESFAPIFYSFIFCLNRVEVFLFSIILHWTKCCIKKIKRKNTWRSLPRCRPSSRGNALTTTSLLINRVVLVAHRRATFRTTWTRSSCSSISSSYSRPVSHNFLRLFILLRVRVI